MRAAREVGKTRPPRIVRVEWADAFSTDEWTTIEDIGDEHHRCVSIGWLVKETKAQISVAGTISEDKQACCIIHIPRGWISRIVSLEEPRGRKKRV